MEFGVLCWLSGAHLIAGVMAQMSTGNVAAVLLAVGRSWSLVYCSFPALL